MSISEKSLQKHYDWKGKIEVVTRCPIETREDLSLAYTPGVATPCLEIQKDVDKSFELTRRSNMVAVITDGTAVLGLGDIGPEAGMPVMEGKCALFKAFADVDAFPLCIRSGDVDEIVRTIYLLSGSFGGINLEDISAPRCFEVEKKLQDALEIPVFHDDQHGTAVVASAALLNALKVVGKNIEDVRIVVNGAGAAGTAITKMFLAVGAKHVLCCDKAGILSPDLTDVFTGAQIELAALTNPDCVKGSLADAVKGADVFLGVSAPRLLTQDMVRSMAKDPVIFAMANPEPEIMPELAKEAGAAVVGTGRSDYPNQINNVMIFPGLFKGALRVRAKRITEEMKVAAAHALAGIVTPEELSADCILPLPLRKDVADIIADAVAGAWRE